MYIEKEDLWWVITLIVIIVLAIALGGFAIWVNITYGNLPITEIPSWAIRFIVK